MFRSFFESRLIIIMGVIGTIFMSPDYPVVGNLLGVFLAIFIVVFIESPLHSN